MAKEVENGKIMRLEGGRASVARSEGCEWLRAGIRDAWLSGWPGSTRSATNFGTGVLMNLR